MTTKRRDLESTDALLHRVDEASKLIDRDRLAIGTQCGFATSLHGNQLGIDDERRKLELVACTAELAFGDLRAQAG